MAKLVWDETGSRQFTAGVDRGVFYPANGPGEVWNGLTSVKESPSDSDVKTRYLDGIKTRNRRGPGSFSGTIEAYTYPDSFYEDVLTSRKRTNFGLSYRVKSKIHLVYNVLLVPSQTDYQYDEPSTFSWGFTTRPIEVPDAKPSAHLVIDTSVAYSWTVEALENALYGSDEETAHLPSPGEVIDIFDVNSILRVVDNGDGTWTATGPDEAIAMLDDKTFEITWPSAIFIDDWSYKLSSL